MSNIKSEIFFNDSGLDFDSAYEFIGVGSSRYRWHVQISHDGSTGIIENMKGNHLAKYELSLSNVYRVGGSTYDRLNRCIYFFIFSQPYNADLSGSYEYDNKLLRFNEDTETIELIFDDSKNYFGINPNYVVKDCNILGDWLFFNPRVSEPKMIDVVMAKNYTDYLDYDPLSTYVLGNKVKYFGGLFSATGNVAIGLNPCSNTALWYRVGDCYQENTALNFDNEFRYAFNVHKQVPVYRPVCLYGTDADKNANNVRGKVFRFTHRYKYFDNSYSRFSAFSDWTLPQYDEYYNGEVPGDLDTYNFINVSISLHSAALVKEIEIGFQEIGMDWRLAKIINRQEQALLDDISIAYKFYNTDSAYVVLDKSLFDEPHDSVPRWAQAQELINKNILTYGGVTEGFDNIPKESIDVTLTPEIEALSVTDSKEDGGRFRDNISSGDWVLSQTSTGWQLTLTPNSWFTGGGWAANDIFVIKINDVTVTYTLQEADVLNLSSFCTALGQFLVAQYPTLDIGYGSTVVTIVIVGEPIILGQSIFYQPSGVLNVSLSKYRGFKTGAWHPFCIFYYDKAMRRCDAQTSKENIDSAGYSIEGTTVYVPMPNEMSPPLTDTAFKWRIDWSVSHLPPDYAKFWRWGYAGNALCSKFVQYVIESIADSSPWTRMDITPLQTLKTTSEATWNQFPQSIIDPYQWEKGDRVRIITDAAAGSLGSIHDGVLDYEIVKYEESDTGEHWIYTQDIDFTGAGIGSLVEIYSPLKRDAAKVFHEFGEIMPIIEDSDGNLVHGVGVAGATNQDTVIVTPATGSFLAGDVFHILRTPSYPINTITSYFHESKWYSDFYDSDVWDNGRIGVETAFNQRTLNIVRFSNQYLQNTGINGLTTFEGNNYKEINDIYGSIQAIMEVGNTLKVYMEKKSASILIGRQEYVDTQGQSTIATSERVLGSVRYPENNFGTQWIESVTKNNKFIYGFDIFNGVLWRDSSNGIFPVSGRFEDAYGNGDYKMETYFRAKAEALALSGRAYTTVMTVWDERYDCLWVIFRDLVNEENDETIAFHEPSNRWITFADFTQTPAEGYNVMLELDYWVLWGFENGIGFSFDEDTRFAIFDIETPPDVIAFPDEVELTYTLLAPTIVIDCTVEMPLLTLQMSQFGPTITTPFISLLPTALAWNADEYGSAYEEIITVDCSPISAYYVYTLTYNSGTGDNTPPSGLDALYFYDKSNLQQVGAGTVLYDGMQIGVYPLTRHTGAYAQCYFMGFAYAGSPNKAVSLERNASTSNPTVRIQSLGGDSNPDNALHTVAGGGTCAAGATSVDVTFTCDHKDFTDATNFWVFATVEIRDSLGNLVSNIGSGEVNTNEQAIGAMSITNLGVAVQSGYFVYVYLNAYRVGVIPPSNTIATAGLLGMTLTLNAPTIFITELWIAPTGATWIYTQSGLADATTITVTYRMASETRVQSFPSWLAIIDSDGNDLTGGHYIYRDGFEDEDIRLYPIDDNLSGGDMTGIVVLTNESGQTYNIPVTHYKEALAMPITLNISGSDVTGLSFNMLSGRSATVYSTSTVRFIGTFDSATQDPSSYFEVYWRCTVNGISRGNGNFTARNARDVYDGLSGYNVDQILSLVGVTLDKYSDTIVIYFAGNSI